MGEKERGNLEEESRQTPQTSFGERAARPREAGSQREGGGVMHEDTWTGQALSAQDPDGGGVPDPAEAGIVKSKSNITNNRDAAPGGGGAPEEMATNLNSSKSNIYRTAGPDDSGSDFAINEPGVHRDAGTAGAGDPEAMAANLNTSRSNIYRTAGPDGGNDDEAGLAIGDQGAVEEKKPRPK